MQIPNLPVFPNFESDEVLHFFKLFEILKFAKENPLYTQDAINGQYETNQENIDQLTINSAFRGIDQNIKNLALSERELAGKFFESVIDQPSFWSYDHARFRKFLLDWYASNRTLVTKSRRAIDPYSLSGPELDELMLSFGFPYPYELIYENKGQFLHNLINFYKHKGTPKVLTDVLTYFGFVDVVLSEWWLEKGSDNNLYMRSTPVLPKASRGDTDYIQRVSYKQFVKDDPNWYYDKPNSDEILSSIVNESTNPITLPSLTPYLSLNNVINHNKINIELSIVNRKMQESYEWWIKYCTTYKGTFTSKTSILNIEEPETYSVARLTDESNNEITDYVYNGEEWINLGIDIPTSVTPDLIDASSFQDLLLITPEQEYTIGTCLDTNLEYVYHGGIWDLKNILLPINWLTNKPECNSETIYEPNRVLSLNVSPTMKHSFFESMIGLMYLFGQEYVEDSESGLLFPQFIKKQSHNKYNDFLFYDGTYSPLDFVYTDSSGSISDECRDDSDDVNYDNIRSEYYNIVKRLKDEIDTDYDPTTTWEDGFEQLHYIRARDVQKVKLIELKNTFYAGNYSVLTGTESFMTAIINSDKFLQILDPKLYKDINLKFRTVSIIYPQDYSWIDRVTETYFQDIAYYLKVYLGLGHISRLPALMVGMALFEKVKDIINFFKPFRARLTSYITEYVIDDPLSDCAYLSDEENISGIGFTYREEVVADKRGYHEEYDSVFKYGNGDGPGLEGESAYDAGIEDGFSEIDDYDVHCKGRVRDVIRPTLNQHIFDYIAHPILDSALNEEFCIITPCEINFDPVVVVDDDDIPMNLELNIFEDANNSGIFDAGLTLDFINIEIKNYVDGVFDSSSSFDSNEIYTDIEIYGT